MISLFEIIKANWLSLESKILIFFAVRIHARIEWIKNYAAKRIEEAARERATMIRKFNAEELEK